MIKCCVCGQEFSTARGLANHYRAKHKLTGDEYWKIAYPIDTRVESIDYVVCPICGAKRHNLTKHLRYHKLTKKEFLEKYPNYQMISERTRNLMVNAAKEEYKYRAEEMARYGSEAMKKYNSSPDKWNEELRMKSSKRLTNTLNRLWKDPNYIEAMRKERSERFNDPEYAKKMQNTNSTLKEYEPGLKFRSSYEYRLAKKLIEANIPYKYEPFFIYYTYRGIKKKYFPDFYIPEYNLIIEVKPQFLVNDEMNVLKMKACIDKGYNFIFITEFHLSLIESSSTIERIIMKEIS